MKEIFLYEWEWTKLPEGINPRELQAYLAEVWASKNLLYNQEDEVGETEEDISDLKRYKQGFLRFDGNFIAAKNYVGFIQYNGYAINILPKVFKNSFPNPVEYIETITSNLLHWLKFSKRIQFPFSEVSYEEQKFNDFLEPFIYIFSAYTNRLLESLPYQRFEEVTETTTFLKGRLAIKDYIKDSLSTGNFQRIISTYDTFQFDNKFNRIIKCVSKLLLQNTNNDYSIERLQNILFILDEVEDGLYTSNDCDTIEFNKIYSEWNSILNMSRMFLANQAFKNQQLQKPNFCFLVPMELIFEEYIAGILEVYGTKKILTQGAGGKKYLTEEKLFMLKPDIIYPDSMILDTKYKLLADEDVTNKYNIAQSDLYQMLAYAVRYKSKKICLVYPFFESSETITKTKNLKTYSIKEEFSNRTVRITIMMVLFGSINNDYNTHDQNLVSELEVFQNTVH